MIDLRSVADLQNHELRPLGGAVTVVYAGIVPRHGAGRATTRRANARHWTMSSSRPIDANREYGVEAMCRVLEVAPGCYYDWPKQPV